MDLDDMFDDGVDSSSEEVDQEVILNNVQTKTINIKVVKPDFSGPFASRVQVSKRDPGGFYLIEEKITVYIDAKTGNPRNLEEGIPPRWRSWSGVTIEDPGSRGVCTSWHHKTSNKNVFLGEDGELVFRWVRADLAGLDPSQSGSRLVRMQVARCSKCLRLERQNMAIAIAGGIFIGGSLLMGAYMGALGV